MTSQENDLNKLESELQEQKTQTSLNKAES